MCGEIIDKDVISMCASNASDKTGINIRGSLSSFFPLLPYSTIVPSLTCAFSHWIKSCARTTNRPALCSTNSQGKGGSKSSVSIRCMAGRRTGSKGISLLRMEGRGGGWYECLRKICVYQRLGQCALTLVENKLDFRPGHLHT